MKIISGGQTGVDRGALDAAMELGIPHGGWCPRGRTAEDGRIPDRYQLRETDSPDYSFRTEQNVLDSDATLILYRGRIAGGTELTLRLARQHGRPHLVVDLDAAVGAGRGPPLARRARGRDAQRRRPAREPESGHWRDGAGVRAEGAVVGGGQELPLLGEGGGEGSVLRTQWMLQQPSP